MTKPFGGTINVDVRDSEPDWGPFEPPRAPDGAPNVLYIVLDDVGFSAMSCYGGPIETPNIDRIVEAGVRYTQFHTTALCSPTRSCLLTGRNHTRNSMACITEAAIGFPNASGTVPPENGMLSEILGERGLEHVHGRQVASVPDRRDEPRRRRGVTGRAAADSSAGTASSAPRRTSGIRTSSTTTTRSISRQSRGGLSPHRGHHRQGARSSSGTRRRSLRRSRSSCTTRPARAMRRITRRRSGSTSSRAASTWATRRSASRPSRVRRSSGSCRPDTELPPVNPIGTPETRKGPEGQPFPEVDYTRPWDSLNDDEKRLFCAHGRGVRRLPRARRPSHRAAPRLSGARPSSSRTR